MSVGTTHAATTSMGSLPVSATFVSASAGATTYVLHVPATLGKRGQRYKRAEELQCARKKRAKRAPTDAGLAHDYHVALLKPATGTCLLNHTHALVAPDAGERRLCETRNVREVEGCDGARHHLDEHLAFLHARSIQLKRVNPERCAASECARAFPKRACAGCAQVMSTVATLTSARPWGVHSAGSEQRQPARTRAGRGRRPCARARGGGGRTAPLAAGPAGIRLVTKCVLNPTAPFLPGVPRVVQDVGAEGWRQRRALDRALASPGRAPRRMTPRGTRG